MTLYDCILIAAAAAFVVALIYDDRHDRAERAAERARRDYGRTTTTGDTPK